MMEFVIATHGHHEDCDEMWWGRWNSQKIGVRPVENLSKHKDYEQCWRLCKCAGPPHKNIMWCKSHYHHWNMVGGKYREWDRFQYQHKKYLGDFYGSSDDKWDSFHFRSGFSRVYTPRWVNGNTLPSKSWHTKAFISKQFMAQRIVEIAFCAHVLGRMYGSETTDGTFASRIDAGRFRTKKHEEFQRKRTEFLVMMEGACYLELSSSHGTNGSKHMCFSYYFDA
jgi:hypothetical protein